MTAKQVPGRTAPDGSEYVTLVDGAGNLSPATGGGGGGAVTIADGAAVTLGTTTDAKNTATDTTAVTAISVLKQISASVQAPPSQVVTATNLSTNLAQVAGTTTATGSGVMTAGTPRMALATDSPGLITVGTAGSASSQVVTIQGVASMTPVQVSPSAATTGGFSFLNIAAGQATTTVKSGAGTLHSIVLNSAATATNVTTVYDNTAGSGTVIAIPAVTTATVPVSLIFDIAFATGLTIVTATANGGNMTVCYK